ncbi:hypothetical protein [Pseudomonas qingdaonensis]|uniref:hypothetical protein n=1 Tax=Pseudomonas qingdaonensis TaxID=2056231 RepID=UPI001F360CB0|nr:hypothetical protein [Pseudomonas qingdaonensis]
MSIDTDTLLKVIADANSHCAKLNIPLDTEIICARYNAHCERYGLAYSYDIREMQATLAELIQQADAGSPAKLDGAISYVNGTVFKVVVFGAAAS